LISLQFANITTSLIEAMVSVKRLSSFLHAPELQPDARTLTIKPRLELGAEVLKIKDGEFEWTEDQAESTLHGIDLTVRKGELVGVLGRVGAGKVRRDVSLLRASYSLFCHSPVYCLLLSVRCIVSTGKLSSQVRLPIVLRILG